MFATLPPDLPLLLYLATCLALMQIAEKPKMKKSRNRPPQH
jgi:hypothetical protein